MMRLAVGGIVRQRRQASDAARRRWPQQRRERGQRLMPRRSEELMRWRRSSCYSFVIASSEFRIMLATAVYAASSGASMPRRRGDLPWLTNASASLGWSRVERLELRQCGCRAARSRRASAAARAPARSRMSMRDAAVAPPSSNHALGQLARRFHVGRHRSSGSRPAVECWCGSRARCRSRGQAHRSSPCSAARRFAASTCTGCGDTSLRLRPPYIRLPPCKLLPQPGGLIWLHRRPAQLCRPSSPEAASA